MTIRIFHGLAFLMVAVAPLACGKSGAVPDAWTHTDAGTCSPGACNDAAMDAGACMLSPHCGALMYHFTSGG